MQYLRTILLGTLLCGCSGCGPSAPSTVPAFDPETAMALTTAAAAQMPRHSGTPGAAQQAEFIAAKAREFGARATVETFEDITPEGKITFRNVVVKIDGKSDRYLIVGCHYDAKKLLTVPSFPAANDGASGVGVLLAMIKSIAASPQKPYYSLRFVFFDGEECLYQYGENDGLHGSRHYADKIKMTDEIKRCRAMILLDMVGDRDLLITPPADSDPYLAELCRQSAEATGHGKKLLLSGQGMLDDHVPFQKAGIPVINLIDFNYGANNAFWHTAEDSMDKISAESLKATGEIVMRMVYHIK